MTTRSEAPFDRRFPTRNTNLAACLGALRVPIKSPDPCWVVEESEGSPKKIVTYFFEMASIPKNPERPPEESDRIDWAWRNRAQFELENPDHPLIPMRKALEKLEWLTKVYYGNIKPAARPGTFNYQTDNTNLAACLMASGADLHSFDKPFYRFSEQPSDETLQAFEDFRSEQNAVCYMRKVLEVRAVLIDLVKRAPVLLRYTNGDPMTGGKEGFIARGASDKNLNIFLDLLHEES